MLIVAPRGRTKDETSFETPRFRWLTSMVTGSVAPLELDEKARSWAGAIPRKNRPIFMLEKILSMTG